MESGINPKVRARIVAFGKVQGVFYRDTLRRAAEQQGVCGSAVNLHDLSVEAILEGRHEAVAAVIDVARQGPPGAHVERLEIFWEDPKGVSGFRTGGPDLPR